MASIPLPALNVRTPEQPDLLQKFGQLQQLKAMQQQQAIQQQEAPLRMQALQTQAQGGQLQLQQEQQAQQDQQSFRAAMQDPSLQGKTIGQVADALAQKGQISQAGWAQAKKADLDHQEAVQKLDTSKLANVKAAHEQTQQLYNGVMNLPDDQVAANWPQIVQQIQAIPGNEKLPLNPAQPMTKQQLQQFGPLLSMGQGYIDSELARREAAAKAKTAEQTAEAGGTTDLAKFQADYLKAHNLDNTPANRQKAFDVYTEKTKIAPAQVRAETFMQMPQAVYDPDSGQNVYTTRRGAIGKEAPSSADALAAKAGVQADASSLKNLQKNFDQVSAFEGTATKNLDLFVDKLSKIPDLGSKFANVPMRMIDSKMIGSDNYQAMKAAQQTAAAEAAKVLSSANASGVLSDTQKKEAEEMLSGNLSLSAAKKVVATLKQDFANRHQSYQEQIGQIQNRMKGTTQPSDAGGPPAGAKVRDYTTLGGK
jgi:hypothetical protein